MSELKPCPTCKGTKNVQVESTDRKDRTAFTWTAQVICLDCFTRASCHGFHSTEQEAKEIAINMWNKRPIEDKLRAENERLRSGLLEIANVFSNGGIRTVTMADKCVMIAEQVLKEVTK